MKVKRITIALHVLVLVLLLVIPYVSTDQVFRTLDPSCDKVYLLLSLGLSTILLSIFYFNYLFLIPRYLLRRKYWQYFSFLLLSIITIFLIAGVFLSLSGFNPEAFL